MSGRKQRPPLHAPVTAGMSLRDVAAALGVNKSELHRWRKLADLPQAVFEQRLAECHHGTRQPTAAAIVAERVPARGRVQRALAIVASMTAAERAEFVERLEATL